MDSDGAASETDAELVLTSDQEELEALAASNSNYWPAAAHTHEQRRALIHWSPNSRHHEGPPAKRRKV